MTLHQLFRIWVIPFFSAPVTLTTVLRLVEELPARDETRKQPKYRIQSQNDLYQVNEFFKFFSLTGVASVLLLLGQFVATGFCVVGTWLFWWVSWAEQNVVGGNRERGLKDVVNG